MSGWIWRVAVAMLFGVLGTGVSVPASRAENPTDLDRILSGIEQRYAGSGFTVAFFQESILKAMRITDTAEGRLTVKRPGKMHWEYIIPDPQTIITDGKTMWIHRPLDNQVMVGRAPAYFGDGKGAGFLSDMRQLRTRFTIRLQPAESDHHYRLQLVPHEPTGDLTNIVLSVSRTGFQIDQVVTYNAHGDETRIVLSDYRFNIVPDETLFTFTVPEGTDIIQMDQF